MLLSALLACSGSEPTDGWTRTPTDPDATAALDFDGERPLNLLMISIDTTRRDHIDRYATDAKVRTPFLSQKLAEGVALDDHTQCSSWTYHATTCTLTGQFNEEFDWVAKLNANTRSPVPDEMHFLAERLKEHGYATVLAASNAWLSTEWNNAQGYDDAPRLTSANTTVLFDEGLSRMRTAIDAGADRWFLHVHLVEPHPPYTPPDAYMDEANALPPLPPEYDLDSQPGHYDTTAQWPTMTAEEQELLAQHLEARYSGELRHMDDQLATLWERLESEGWLDGTLVVIWNDHGEQFWEHGDQTHAYILAAEENDGFLAFWARDLEPRAWTDPTHATDLVPTVLDALGLEVPTDGSLPGYVLGTAPEGRPRFASVVARRGPVVSVIDDGYKLQYNFGGALRLWHREQDRAELVDVLESTSDDRVEALWSLLLPRVYALQPLVPEFEQV